MEILLQSDGQLYPPRPPAPKEPPKKPKPAPPPPPEPPKPLPKEGISIEELLLMGVAFLIIRSSDHPDLPLLLALAYILFDSHFSLGRLPLLF